VEVYLLVAAVYLVLRTAGAWSVTRLQRRRAASAA